MCGVIGIFSFTGPVDSQVLGRATRSLAHRGPDGQRQWISADGRAGLGHARLSIIDLTTGDQPIANEDEHLRVVVNGELYGYEAQRRELEAAGHRLRTKSDSEIVLHYYEDLGSDCLARLRGEFAIVLWDGRQERVFAARDRFGIKPLFYAEHAGKLYLASEVKALLAAGVPARWDGATVYDALLFGPSAGRSLFAGIHPVPPGHYLVADARGVRLQRYWDFDYPDAPIPPRDDAAWAEEFRGALEEAVRLRLRADVPVGCYLSGGIDSCAILALAARHHPAPVRAFTLSFDRPEYDERQPAERMAARAGAQFAAVPVRQDEIAENAAAAIAQAETLFANAHGVAKFLLSRAVRQAGYKVVLTGEGSDEILGGYMHFRQDLCPNGNAAASGAQYNDTVAALNHVRGRLGFVPGWMRISAVQNHRLRALLAADFREQFRSRETDWLDEMDIAGQLAGREPLHQSLYLWAKTRLPNYLLAVLGDRMEMAHSIEGRVPFLDHHVVEVTRRQPAAQKIRGGVHKFVLRQAMQGLVTDEVIRHPKQAFLSPPVLLAADRRLGEFIGDTLSGPALKDLAFFDTKKVQAFVSEVQGGDETARAANDTALLTVMSACVLQQRYQLTA